MNTPDNYAANAERWSSGSTTDGVPAITAALLAIAAAIQESAGTADRGQATAWDEGYEAGRQHARLAEYVAPFPGPTNPYRKE